MGLGRFSKYLQTKKISVSGWFRPLFMAGIHTNKPCYPQELKMLWRPWSLWLTSSEKCHYTTKCAVEVGFRGHMGQKIQRPWLFSVQRPGGRHLGFSQPLSLPGLQERFEDWVCRINHWKWINRANHGSLQHRTQERKLRIAPHKDWWFHKVLVQNSPIPLM